VKTVVIVDGCFSEGCCFDEDSLVPLDSVFDETETSQRSIKSPFVSCN